MIKAEIAGAHPITAWRNHQGWTRDDLAHPAGLDPDTITAIECGGATADDATLRQLAKAMAVAVDLRYRPDASADPRNRSVAT